jgi:predicted ATPase
MIKSFQVSNYKALRDATLELSPLHVLIGPNDSGISSLLEALAALCRSVDMPLADAFAGPWTGRQLVWQNLPDVDVSFDTTLADELGDLEYQLSCRFRGPTREVVLAAESARILPTATVVKLYDDEFPWTRVHRSHLHRNTPNDEAGRVLTRRIHDLLGGVHLYQWNARFLALPVASQADRQFQMDSSGFGLALVLDDILGYDRNRFIALEERFRQIFPDFKSIKLVRETAYRAPEEVHRAVPLLQQAEGKGIHFELARDGRVIPASQVSDGVLLVLAYLTVLHLPQPPRVILVEEPENGIHPRRLQDVMNILRELVTQQSHTQVLMTTHSPYVVDLMKPEEVSLCQKGADSAVTVHRLSNSRTVREQLDVFSLGEIWTAEGEEAIVNAGANSDGAGA